MKTGMIGLGAMGLGMARRLAEAGHLTCVYNRTAAKAGDLAREFNVRACVSPRELAAEADLILICVSADRDVLEIISAVSDTIRPGSVVVDMSTVSSETARQAAAILTRKQAEFLDAPVSGGVEGAWKGSLSMMAGGKAEVLEQVRPVLACLATRITHMGETGAGQATKAVNQIMAAGINQAVTEALAFALAQELPMEKVIDVISGGAAGNWFLQHRGLTMTQAVFKPGFKVALHLKDLKICEAIAGQLGLSVPLTEMTIADYQTLIENGGGDQDISSLFRLKKK